MKKISLIILVLISTGLFFSCKNKGEKKSEKIQELVIFHAGSLSVPFSEICKEFEKENPGVKIYREAAGSRACARKITDLKKECDIMASADYTVIDDLLIPEYANWNIKFASNEMTIVYHKDSKHADKINKDNWYNILMQDDVIFGRSNPEADPCGYRAVLTMKLAEEFYTAEGLAEKFLAKDVNYIRPKETDLLALLESGSIDYIFLYRSVAQQHGLDFLSLPEEVNLKNPEMANIYAKATVELTGKTPGEKIVKKGEPMVYGITIPNNAPNKELAVKFVDFILDKDKGMKIMEKNGQPSLVPSKSETFQAIPEQLKKYSKQ